MTLPLLAAGPYTAAYNAGAGPRSLGLVEGVRRWQRLLEATPVRAALFGLAEIDGVYRGGQCFCRMTLKEFSPAVRDALWPFASRFGALGAVGRLLTDLAGELVLEAAPHTTAAAVGPRRLIFRKAILAPGSEVEIPLGDAARDIPVTFRCYPYLDAQGAVVWFEEEA